MRKFKLIIALFTVSVIALTTASCSSIISKKSLKNADTTLTVRAVQDHIDTHKGKTVIWGGIIINTKNRDAVTEIEILETGVDKRGYPEFDMSKSQGRFVVVADKFLDPLIFSARKYITIAGTVDKLENRTIDEMQYPYVILKAVEIHIFEDYKDQDIGSQHYPSDYMPYYSPYHPYWGPLWTPYW